MLQEIQRHLIDYFLPLTVLEDIWWLGFKNVTSQKPQLFIKVKYIISKDGDDDKLNQMDPVFEAEILLMKAFPDIRWDFDICYLEKKTLDLNLGSSGFRPIREKING